jgi:hypothetical protein
MKYAILILFYLSHYISLASYIMSCMWSGILDGLQRHGLIPNSTRLDTFVQLIKSKNHRTSNISCNGEILSEKECDENYLRIEEISHINKGYLCSAFDPLLFLISSIYNVNITHDFCSTIIRYCHEEVEPISTLYFGSSVGHFWFDRKSVKIESKKQKKKAKELIKSKEYANEQNGQNKKRAKKRNKKR